MAQTLKQGGPLSSRQPHEVRVTSSGSIKSYIAYAERMLEDPQVGYVKFVGEGKTLDKVVSVAEILKRKRTCLHQVTDLSGGDLDERGRETPKLCITLAPQEDKLDTTHPGYSAPE